MTKSVIELAKDYTEYPPRLDAPVIFYDIEDLTKFAEAYHKQKLGEMVPVAYVSKDTAYYFGISDRSNSGVFRYGKFLEATEPLYSHEEVKS